MKNLKIKAKLLFGFVAVSMLTIIVGVVGTIGLKSIDTSYRELIQISSAGISSIADVRELFQMQRLTLRTFVININDPAQIQSEIDRLKENEAKMAEAMAVYESTITDPASEQKYYMAKDAYLTGYSVVKQKIIDAVQSGDHDKALETLAEAAIAAQPVTEGLQGTVDFINGLMEQDLANMESHSLSNIIIQIVVMSLAAVCAMTLGIYIASLISKPIKTMSDFFVRFGSTGDLSLSEEDKKNIEIQSQSRDETGQCISAAAAMVSRLMEIDEKLGKLANGDLTVDMRALSEKDSLGLAVIRMIDSLNTVFSELHASAGQVSTGSEQIAQGAQELASGSSQQAASIEEFANSLDALKEKTDRNAENSVNAAKVNDKISSMLEESVHSMSQMLGAMKEIDESSKSITRVIKVIDDIAFQTNILALNAAVEAARAGQHGKGFAVVADEVRNLASKSAAAAKETAALIEGSSEKVREGNQIVDKTNASLESVAEGSREVVRLIAEVSAGSAEQADAINEMHQSIGQISNVVQENSASAEESAAASEQMSSQAAMLNDIVARFKMKPSATIGAHTVGKISSQGKTASSHKNAVNHYEKY